MAAIRPMLGDLDLAHVQKIDVDGRQVLTNHSVPAMEGDFLQDLGRRASRVVLEGVISGEGVRGRLSDLREKFRAAEPVPFVADMATATRVDSVLIEEMGVREVAGRPDVFEYAFTLREFTPPPAVAEEEPPEIEVPETPDEEIDERVGTLVVDVMVEGRPEFDLSNAIVSVEGSQEDSTALSRTLSNRSGNTWTEDKFPAGRYTVTVTATGSGAVTGSAPADVPAGGKENPTVVLRPGQIVAKAFLVHFWFDKSFIEPCMRHVLLQAAEYARDHADEKLLIVGHSDKVGDDPPVSPLYNQSLSERRARSVYACLTFSRDRTGAQAEWDRLRRPRPAGSRKSVNDTWGTREYQLMLMDLGYYSGDINEIHDKDTDAAVRAFQNDNGLASDGIVGDQTWSALIEAYLDLGSLAVPEDRFLKNAGDGCDGGVLRWIGCGEQNPVKNTSDAWRPNRRTEILFVKAESLPCKVPKPDTFDIPPGVVGSTWCLGPGNENARCCFLTKDPASKDRWIVQPMEPGNVIVEGSITFDDKTPLANAEYIITAPDGEYMDGEKPLGPNRGRPVPGHTDAQGRFSYPDRPKGVGIYSLEVKEPFIIRPSDKPHEPAKGHLVCKRLEGKLRLDVIVCKPAITFDLEVRGAIKAGIIGTDFVAAQSSSEDAIVTAVSSAGTCITPRSIVWIGGEEVQGNPIQRRVSRATTGPTTVTATMPASGVTRSITITVISTQLEAIEFNHDSSSASGDALNIRKNKTTFVTVPEWQRGISTLPQDSPAAYAIQDTQGKTITIKARFKISMPLAIAIEVRAIAPNIKVLGEVKARSISFLPTGETGFESLELVNVKIWDKGVGVGIHDIDWKWQLRLQPSDSWTDFASSRHRIYTVLKVPNLPWQQLPYTSGNDQIPWIEVLDHACRWASKETDIDGAATKVTKEVYDLGKSIIEYDCPGGGGTRYASPSFNCTEFLERLGGGVGLGRYVNCTDCATIVSTFANILGSDLWQSRMGNRFDLNPILAIGSGTWQTACGWPGFSYHEVAWKGACTAGESVFDACLKVDGDSDPTRAPHTPLLVANIRFGNEYRDRMAADSPTGRPKCQPQPATRTRRKVI